MRGGVFLGKISIKGAPPFFFPFKGGGIKKGIILILTLFGTKLGREKGFFLKAFLGELVKKILGKQELSTIFRRGGNLKKILSLTPKKGGNKKENFKKVPFSQKVLQKKRS